MRNKEKESKLAIIIHEVKDWLREDIEMDGCNLIPDYSIPRWKYYAKCGAGIGIAAGLLALVYHYYGK